MALSAQQEKRLTELESRRPSGGGLTPKQEKKLAELESRRPPTEESKPDISMAQSAVGGLGQGTTFAFGDELAGAVGSAHEKVYPMETARKLYANYVLGIKGAKDLPNIEGDTDFQDFYREIRNFARDQVEAERAANPKVFAGTEIGGAIASSAPMAAQGVMANAALGGLYGLGGSEADLTDPSLENFGQAALDTGIGAGFGGGTSAVLKGAAGPVGRMFKGLAEKRAVLLANLSKSRLGQIVKKEGQEGLDKLGREILDEGIVKFKFGASGAQKRNQLLLEKSGKRIGSILDPLHEQGIKNFDVQRVHQEILDTFPENQLIDDAFIKEVKHLIKVVTSKGDDMITGREGWQIAKAIENRARIGVSKTDPTFKKEMSQRVSGIIRGEIKRSVGDAAVMMKNPELLDDFLLANKNFALGSELEDPLAKKVAGDYTRNLDAPLSKRDFAPMNLISGFADTTVLNPGMLDAAGSVAGSVSALPSVGAPAAAVGVPLTKRQQWENAQKDYEEAREQGMDTVEAAKIYKKGLKRSNVPRETEGFSPQPTPTPGPFQ